MARNRRDRGVMAGVLRALETGEARGNARRVRGTARVKRVAIANEMISTDLC